METQITLITTGILGILFFIHSIRTIAGRKLTKTNLGDGGTDLMVRRIRIHGNFAEYIPFLLLVLLLLEIRQTATSALVAYASMLIVGRVLHFYGLYSQESPMWARVSGMHLTLWPLLVGSIYLLYFALL